MEVNRYLLLALLIAIVAVFLLITKIWRVREQLSLIQEALADIKAGNLNRRVLVSPNDMTKQICYDLNEIAVNSQAHLIRQRQSEQAYKRLMTSLSHDVKTPLASMVGYLEAVESGLVTGEEKEEYIHVAAQKAHYMQHFVEKLFEWVKLDAGEQIFHFEECDINEVTRSIMTDWIPILENSGFAYDIDICENECKINLDQNAYARILNNLLQNAITHSGGDRLSLQISEEVQSVKIAVSDNGAGISEEDLPHIFERMYQCDHSRRVQGNGLGLAITKELVSAHKGTITVESTSGEGAAFIILLPRNAVN